MKKAIVALLLLTINSGAVFASEMKDIFIPTPNPCVKVESVNEGDIYLVSSKDSCVQVTAKTKVKVNGAIKKFRIMLDGKLWNEHEVKSFGVSAIQGNQGQVSDFEKIIENSEQNIYNDEALKVATELNSKVLSDEYQAKIKAESKRIETEVFAKYKLDEYYADDKSDEVDGIAPSVLPENQRIYVFVSSSVPTETLRNYARMMDKIPDTNVIMVLRGFVGGMKYIKPTMKYIRSIIQKDPSCLFETGQKCDVYAVEVIVDPLLYQRYEIDRVPTFAYVKNVSNATNVTNYTSEGLDYATDVGDVYKITGDLPIDTMLQRINDEAKSDELHAYISGLRSGFYK